MKKTHISPSRSSLGWPILSLLAVAALGADGCATTRYGYRPTAINASNEAGFPASRYGVPADAPQGEAFVTSFGTRELEDGERGGAQLVHVRLAVANDSSPTPWSIDPGRLLLRPATGNSAGGAGQKPDFMEVDGRQNGGTEIARGQRRVLDLYYRMPPGSAATTTPPAFDFSWEVNLGSTVFAEHTPFTREPYEQYERQNERYVAVGVVPPWWWGWYGAYWWGPYGWPYYYGYRPYVGVGVGYRGYGAPRAYHGGHMGRPAGGRVGPTVRGHFR